MNQQDLWNERYKQKGSVWGVAPNEFVADRLEGLEPCRVLDLGSGQGRNSIWMAQQGHAVTAVDVSDVATARGAEIAASMGVEVEFVAADLESWQPPTEAFDLVILSYMQAPGAIREAIHAKATAALVPGGRVFVIAHHRDNLENGIGGPPMIEVLFDEDLIAGDFPGFEIIENTRVLRRVDKGEDSGEAIDLLFYATKA